MSWHIFAGIVLCALALFIKPAICGEGNTEMVGTNSTSGTGRFMSLFSVVRFANSFCYGSNGLDGSCYTSAECAAVGGSSSGTCASGFGVCCTVRLTTCGKTISVNNTYWANPGYSSGYTTAGQCNVNIKKCSPDICQIRLDFVNFEIAGPTGTQCTFDSFTVSGQSNNVPAICGINTDQHMYLDMTPGSSQFTLNMLLTGTTTRTWNIRISQIPCGTFYTAPDGCLQWFTTSVGTFSSFNFQTPDPPSSQHLANQDYTICIRMNQGFCGICYSVCDIPANIFSLDSAVVTSEADCKTDWIQIPCATDQQNSLALLVTAVVGSNACINKICGPHFSTDPLAIDNAPVYSYRKPFEVRVYTDKDETGDTASGGFCLKYQQLSCTSG